MNHIEHITSNPALRDRVEQGIEKVQDNLKHRSSEFRSKKVYCPRKLTQEYYSEDSSPRQYKSPWKGKPSCFWVKVGWNGRNLRGNDEKTSE